MFWPVFPSLAFSNRGTSPLHLTPSPRAVLHGGQQSLGLAKQHGRLHLSPKGSDSDSPNMAVPCSTFPPFGGTFPSLWPPVLQAPHDFPGPPLPRLPGQVTLVPAHPRGAVRELPGRSGVLGKTGLQPCRRGGFRVLPAFFPGFCEKEA